MAEGRSESAPRIVSAVGGRPEIGTMMAATVGILTAGGSHGRAGVAETAPGVSAVGQEAPVGLNIGVAGISDAVTG